MKMIVATIRPQKFADVKEALERLGMGQMTVYNVSGSEKDASQKAYGGNAVESNLVGKLRIEIAANDGSVRPIIDAIRKAASTGNPSDGMISVYDLVQSFTIRTGEEGPGTL
jgi:nitrogen regulatory protein PII